MLKDGYRLARTGWNGNGMWIALSPGFTLEPDRIFSDQVRDEVRAQGTDGVFRPYIMMRTVDGEFVPWIASQTDLLAEDWTSVQ